LHRRGGARRHGRLGEFDGASRVIFVGLVGLGAYMIRHSVRARRLLRALSSPERERFVADIGFTLVALFVAFAVIAVLDLGAPGWAAAAVGAAGAGLGHHVVRVVQRRQAAAGAPAIRPANDAQAAAVRSSESSTRALPA
jgi:hypothetical protein